MTKPDDKRKTVTKPDDEREADGGGARRKGGRPAEVSAVIDRVEGERAVLSLGDGKKTIDVPVSRLPKGASDGDHLRLSFDGEPSADTLKRVSRDEGARAAAEERIRRLRDSLEQSGGAAGKKDFKL
ncbi:MAG: DUF3006 domain-containing protein [Acidobacteria bacterium]|nr:DUF3006 domain-containing protein [Acidobacteriota bacterium]